MHWVANLVRPAQLPPHKGRGHLSQMAASTSGGPEMIVTSSSLASSVGSALVGAVGLYTLRMPGSLAPIGAPSGPSDSTEWNVWVVTLGVDVLGSDANSHYLWLSLLWVVNFRWSFLLFVLSILNPLLNLALLSFVILHSHSILYLPSKLRVTSWTQCTTVVLCWLLADAEAKVCIMKELARIKLL